jgi:acetyl-CoA carboxylase biotin carboxyl carrier protein
MEIDKKIIKKLIETLDDLKKSLKDKNIFNSDSAVEEEILTPKKVVKSPIVGTAYFASEPGSKPFVSVGKKIKKGDTVMIVEAMKTMNHIPSSIDGVVKEICVEDGQPIEYDQVLIILE